MSKTILIVSPVPTHPPNAGNRVRLLGLASSMKRLGNEVHFAHIQIWPGDDARMSQYWGEYYYPIPYKRPATAERRHRASALRRIGNLFSKERRYTFGIDDWYDDSASTFLRDLAKQVAFDAVLVVYVFFSKALECFGNEVVKMIDAQDVFTDRHEIYLRSNRRPQFYSTTRTEEAKGLERADVVIAIQSKEEEFFRSITTRRVVTVGHLVTLEQKHQPLVAQRPPQLLIVGSENEINVDGFHFFLKHTFPVIVRQTPGVELLLAGRLCGKVGIAPGCRKLGELDDIGDAYAQADIVINPVRYGTGQNVKSIEALGYGMPLVTTSAGAKGLESGASSAFLVADNPSDFASCVSRILVEEGLAESLAERAFTWASHWNEQCLSALSQSIDRRDHQGFASQARMVQ